MALPISLCRLIILAFVGLSMGLYNGFILGPFPCVLAGFFRGGYRDIGDGPKTPWRGLYGLVGALYGVSRGMPCVVLSVCLSVCLGHLARYGRNVQNSSRLLVQFDVVHIDGKVWLAGPN